MTGIISGSAFSDATTKQNIKMAFALERVSHLRCGILVTDLIKATRFDFTRCCSTKDINYEFENEEETRRTKKFRILELYPKKHKKKPLSSEHKTNHITPRALKMTPETDWTNVWPGPKTFHPASVPLPIHQGCNKKGPPPGKTANTELMKIPNFLHLTPPAIEKHCKALKKFCTEWPENLKTDEDVERHFPVEIISSDYCHSSCSIREPKARVISLRMKLKNLELDKHSKDKFLRLVGPRYDPSTDYVTISTDSCPLKKQNYDYAHYLLTAVYFESWKFEEWEEKKSDDDMEEYIFTKRKCFESVKAVFNYNKRELPKLEEFENAVERWLNQGDDLSHISNYKAAAMKLLSLPSLEASA